MRRSVISLSLVCLCVAALVFVQCAIAHTDGALRLTRSSLVTKHQQEAAIAGVAVPLVVCPTSFGISPSPARLALPATTTLSAPSPLSGSLAAYTDTRGYVLVVAPRNWRCSASYGADGSGGVSVYPRGSSVASLREAVVARETSVCYGCTTGQACVFFQAAAKANEAAYHIPCDAHKPRQESVDQLSPTVVAFEDPPGVKGNGYPSGGQFPANGVMTYALPTSQEGSYLETCTLPEIVHSTCTVILNDFVARYGKK